MPAVLYPRSHRIFGHLLTACLVTSALLVQSNLSWFWAVAGLLGSLAMIRALAGRVYLLGGVVLAAMLACAWLDSREDPDAPGARTSFSQAGTGLPPVIHASLDDFIGLGGLPAHPESTQIESELQGFLGNSACRCSRGPAAGISGLPIPCTPR